MMKNHNWNIDEKIDYTYEEFKTSAIIYDYFKGEWSEKAKEQWFYDNKNRLIEKTHNSDYQNLNETHKYDKYGCDIEIINENLNAGTIYHKKECEYYKHLSNRPSKIVDEVVGLVEEYEYNSHLDITLYKEYKSNTPDKYETFVRYSY